MRSICLVLLGVLLVPAVATAQVSRSGLLDVEALHANGLERMWFTQIEVDRARGRMVGMTQFVSPTKAHTVFEFIYDGKRYVFSERDRNAFGEMIGVEGAKLKAETELAAIKANLVAAGKPETEAPALESHVIPEITIAATTDRGILHVLDGETGKTRWATTVGSPRHPTTEPAVNDDFVAVCNGSTLYVYKIADGQLAWQKQVVGAIGAGPAMTDELIYVPMINGTMETYFVENPRRPRIFRAFGRTTVQPVASGESVAWPTDTGKLYVGFARAGTMKYRVEATDTMSAAPTFMPGGKILATSIDGYVYCIEEGRGQVLWRFTTGEPISQSPLAFENTVLAVTDNGELYAINAQEGVELWVTAGIRRILAGNADRIYVTDQTGNIQILDSMSGSRIGGLAATNLDFRYTNVQTDRLLLGTRTGLIQCIRERQLVWPVTHQIREPGAPAAQQPKVATPPKAPAAPMPEADPFGDGGADPFGGGAPAPAPMPMAEPDPFGGDAADPFGGGEMKDDGAAEPDPFSAP